MLPYYRRTDCRLCGSSLLESVLSLRSTPPANELLASAELARNQDVFPLDLHLCRHCGHLQLVDVVDPSRLFGNYVYVSGTSSVFVRHFEDYAAALIARFGLSNTDFVVDIGSNDGVLLKELQEAGLMVLGVDPAQHIATRANSAGIPTWPEFFNCEVASRIIEVFRKPKLVTANNVMAHADDLAGIVRGVQAILAADGVFVIEVSYLADVYASNLFDTIYHEHLAYHALRPLIKFFSANGLDVFDAERVDTHGGSLRVYAQPVGGPYKRESAVSEFVAQEEALGLFDVETYLDWDKRIRTLGHRLNTTLKHFKSSGLRIAGFGAPAKATTLLHQFGIGPSVVDFIVEDSRWKQGLFLPGLGIPIVAPDGNPTDHADVLLVLAWNFADPIIERHRGFIRGGGSFVVPLPQLRIESVHPVDT